MDKVTHEIRIANWKAVLEQCHARPEGQTARQWLLEQGISEKSYYYWQRKIRKRNGVFVSRQNMANWIILCAQRYFQPLYDRMKEGLLTYHVIQCDETPLEVINDGRGAGAKSYIWVHRSGEYYKDKPLILYEY